jgi:hypothetical protein
VKGPSGWHADQQHHCSRYPADSGLMRWWSSWSRTESWGSVSTWPNSTVTWNGLTTR